MKHLISIFLLVSFKLVAQEEDEFLSRFLFEDVLNKENVLEKYQEEDFSNLWTRTRNSQIYGMIGTNHQRIRMVMTSITQNVNAPLEYTVIGKSKVKMNICNFTGVIKIDSILEINQMHYGVDSIYKDSSIVAQGVLFASYELKEPKEENHSGIFNGQLMTRWYINSKGKLKYDNIQSMSDGYMNNTYVGKWIEHRSEESKICNWADNRIPHSARDFDIGAAEFSPSKKYYKFGWEEYQKAWLHGDEQAKNNELSEWWKFSQFKLPKEIDLDSLIVGVWNVSAFGDSDKFKDIWEFKKNGVYNVLEYDEVGGGQSLIPDKQGTWDYINGELVINTIGNVVDGEYVVFEKSILRKIKMTQIGDDLRIELIYPSEAPLLKLRRRR